nr:translation initiation factor IF-2-like [Aegilops tauschii subsp. strangulata]
MVSAAPLSLSRAPSASIIGAAGGPEASRHVDPAAALQEVLEKNALEAQQEREAAARAEAEAADAARAKADATAKAQADVAAKEQAAAAAKAREEKASRDRAPKAIGLQHAEPPVLEDYHNLRTSAYNSEFQELTKRTTDLNQSLKATADLWQCLGEVESELPTKEQERSQAAQERDRLAKQVADQAERHKAEVQRLKDGETLLRAEFETQRSDWAEREKFLSDGYNEIEDMIDKFLPSQSIAVSQAIEAWREVRRRAGMGIPPNSPRNLDEQLLAIKTRLVPAHCLLRHLQRVGSQVLAALWPDGQVPLTPSQTADRLEVAIRRFEAWKGAAARAGARAALEFAKA